MTDDASDESHASSKAPACSEVARYSHSHNATLCAAQPSTALCPPAVRYSIQLDLAFVLSGHSFCFRLSLLPAHVKYH